MRNVLLDTSFLIDLLGGDPRAVSLASNVDLQGEPLRLPSPALYELWRGVAESLHQARERAKVEELLAAYEVAVFDERDARSAGELQASLMRKGGTLGTVHVEVAGMAAARSEALLASDPGLLRLAPVVPVRGYSRA